MSYMHLRRVLGSVCALAVVALGGRGYTRAASVPSILNVDLDGDASQQRESSLSVEVQSPAGPCRVQNKVTNKAVGQNFNFTWYSAGPGGFSSATGAGTTAGVGAIWTWSTYQAITQFTGMSCAAGSANDICFASLTAPGTNRGPFMAPGRRFTDSRVKVSAATLTASLSSFLSPPKEVAHAESSIQPLTSGLFRYTTTFTNPSGNTQPITLFVAQGPLECSGCSEGDTLCDGGCTDIDSDPDNCGACGNICPGGESCSEGVCGGSCDPGQMDCGKAGCVFLDSNVYNCGACFHDCYEELPSCPYPCCKEGGCICDCGSAAAVEGSPPCSFPGITAVTVAPGESFTRCVVNRHPAKEVTSQLTACGPNIPNGPVVCADGPASQGPFNVLVPDTSQIIGPVYLSPFKVRVTEPSGDGLIEPGENVGLKISVINAGSANLTDVVGTLTSPDVDLTEDGTDNLSHVTITGGIKPYPDGIQGIPGDGDGDCTNNDLAALHPSTNASPFMLFVPPGHPEDVARPFNLKVTGIVGLSAGLDNPDFDVHLAIGIASACNPSNPNGTFDGLQGLLSPMAKLVLPGETVPRPNRPIERGATRPLKLRLRCGSLNLGSAQIAAPEIVGLTRDGVPVNPHLIADKDDHDFASSRITPGLHMIGSGGETLSGQDTTDGTDPNLEMSQLPTSVLSRDDDDDDDDDDSESLRFRYSGGDRLWIFNMRTRRLRRGTYVLTVRLAAARDYVTGFVIR